jgi:RNA ligase (TIGR02306 family)
MSSFEVKVRKITVTPHENAEALEIGTIDGYQFVVAKGHWQTGDLGVYIPEQAVVPDHLISEMGLEGRLAGSAKNRVKAIKLRGALSQGLFYKPAEKPLPPHWDEGLDVGSELGIYKYEPPIPASLAGKIREPKEYGNQIGIFRTYTDIENIKKYPDVLEVGEEVVMTEKLHGTCCIFALIENEFLVSSKGIAARFLTLTDEPGNVYWQIAHKFNLREKLEKIAAAVNTKELILFGEGLGVQDLMYGLTKGQLDFRAFDLYDRYGFYNYNEFKCMCQLAGIPTVPLLYQGAYSKEVLAEHTTGKSTLANHIREGVVVKPITERTSGMLGRVIFKSVSEAYLLRKGDNVTEFN